MTMRLPEVDDDAGWLILMHRYAPSPHRRPMIDSQAFITDAQLLTAFDSSKIVREGVPNAVFARALRPVAEFAVAAYIGAGVPRVVVGPDLLVVGDLAALHAFTESLPDGPCPVFVDKTLGGSYRIDE